MASAHPVSLRLDRVRLERFKAAFKPETIEFLPFNVIIGRNGSGKSTVIEALQWVDSALRQDVPRACDPYNGVHDLVNLRSPKTNRFFRIELGWGCANDPDTGIDYNVSVRESERDARPEITEEALTVRLRDGGHEIIRTENGIRRIQAAWQSQEAYLPFSEQDVLALGAAMLAANVGPPLQPYIEALRNYWRRAVFLRLSPIGLATGSRPYRKSFEPLLDQEGKLLPALLGEMKQEQVNELIEAIQGILPDITGLELSSKTKRAEEVHFSLLENVRWRGRTGKFRVPIPSWMLSEGTRRITAILALLLHKPRPTLLCIEEIENGLDPWSVVRILEQLRSASTNGIQIILTTHSPWMLDHAKLDDILLVERDMGETVYRRFGDKKEVKLYQGRIPPGAIYATEG